MSKIEHGPIFTPDQPVDGRSLRDRQERAARLQRQELRHPWVRRRRRTRQEHDPG